MHAFFFGVAGVALILVSLYCFLFSRSLFVREILVVGDGSLGADVEQFIENYLGAVSDDTTYVYSVDLDILKRHMFFVDKEDVVSAVVGEFPTVRDIQVDRVFPHTLEIHIERHDTLVVACEEGVRTRSACALIADSGIVQGRIDPDSSLARENDVLYVRFSGDSLGRGERAFAEGVIPGLRIFIKELPFETGMQVDGDVEVIARGESLMKISTDSNVDLVVDGSHDPRLTMAVLKEFLTKIRNEKKNVKLKEIDLRIKDRVFYVE